MTVAWLGSTRYLDQMACLTNDTVIATLFFIADAVIGLSLAAIAARVWKFRTDGYFLLPHQVKLGVMLAVLMAIGYIIDLVLLFDGVRRLDAVVRGTTAGVAVMFAFSFWIRRR